MSELREWGASAVLITYVAWLFLVLPVCIGLILTYTVKALLHRKAVVYRRRLLFSAGVLIIPVLAARGLEVLITPLPYDPSEARAEILRWHPTGTAVHVVRTDLESRGWTCEQPASPDSFVFLRCDVTLPGLPCKTTWIAELAAPSARLADAQVHLESICL